MPSKSKNARLEQLQILKKKLDLRLQQLAQKGISKEKAQIDPLVKSLKAKIRQTNIRIAAFEKYVKQTEELAEAKAQKLAQPKKKKEKKKKAEPKEAPKAKQAPAPEEPKQPKPQKQPKPSAPEEPKQPKPAKPPEPVVEPKPVEMPKPVETPKPAEAPGDARQVAGCFPNKARLPRLETR